jgi:hypothetical protein
MTRFVTANEQRLWAAVDPDSRCAEPKVAGRRFSAYLRPFHSEGEAAAALIEAGGVLDWVNAPPKPGRQVRR